MCLLVTIQIIINQLISMRIHLILLLTSHQSMVFIKHLSSKTQGLTYFSNLLNIINHNIIYLNYSDSLNQEIGDIPMIDEAFVLDHSLYYEMALFITKKIFAYFLKVYSLNSCVIDVAESIEFAINPSKLINSNYLQVIFNLVKEFYNLFNVYL